HGLVFQTLDERRVTIRPHLLRHGFATWALNVAKEPVDIVARILNQNNLEVTKYYGRPNPRLIAERSHGLMKQISSYIEVEQVTLIQIERARKKGLTLEVIQHQKKLQQCRGELKEMDMIEICREDERREPEVNFDVEG